LFCFFFVCLFVCLCVCLFVCELSFHFLSTFHVSCHFIR
jgi:hypothetical protein